MLSARSWSTPQSKLIHGKESKILLRNDTPTYHFIYFGFSSRQAPSPAWLICGLDHYPSRCLKLCGFQTTLFLHGCLTLKLFAKLQQEQTLPRETHQSVCWRNGWPAAPMLGTSCFLSCNVLKTHRLCLWLPSSAELHLWKDGPRVKKVGKRDISLFCFCRDSATIHHKWAFRCWINVA